MNRASGAFAVLLFFGAVLFFVIGLYGLSADEDGPALFWLVIGALALKSTATLIEGVSS